MVETGRILLLYELWLRQLAPNSAGDARRLFPLKHPKIDTVTTSAQDSTPAVRPEVTHASPEAMRTLLETQEHVRTALMERFRTEIAPRIDALASTMRPLREALEHVPDLSETVADLDHAVAASRLALGRPELGRGLAPTGGSELRQSLIDLLKTGVVEVEAVLPEEILFSSPASAVHWLRFVEEAVENAGAHSGTSQAQLQCDSSLESFSVSVADEGRGFTHDPRHYETLGIGLMQCRASLLGATFSVENRRPGANIQCKLLNRP